MIKDRRRRTRIAAEIGVEMLLGGKPIKLTSVNISLVGMLCSNHPLFQINDPCTVIITLSEEAQISIDARIVRIDKKEAGIAFMSMDEESFFHLKRLVEHNMGDAQRVERELRSPAFM
ncbi:MAG TPA: PilZ domain-containing protein [Syntrophales bacterium]|nr:PilZ domain-containing protein [Syntrophales bacterium]